MRRESTKYDGSLHYSFPVAVVERRADPRVKGRRPSRSCPSAPANASRLLATYCPPGTPIHCYRGDFPARHHDAVRFVDRDLDVMHRVGETPVDDADEFAAHRVAWNYPADVVTRAEAVAADVLDRFHRATPPFDGRLYAWRPGHALPAW